MKIKFDNFKNNSENIESELKKVFKKLKNKFDNPPEGEDPDDNFWGLFYNSKLNTVWITVCSGFEDQNDIKKVEDILLKIQGVDKVKIECEENDPISNSLKDWIRLK